MANVPESKNDRGGHWDNTQDQIARLAADDGVSQWEVQANNLYGWDSAGATWRRVKVDATGTLVGGVSGGGPATIADGADVAQGTTSDVAWVSGSGTVISLLKKIASAGGSAVSIADGADVAQGTTTDLSSANTVVGILKAIKAAITGTVAVSAASLPLPTNAATETTLALQQVSTGTAIGSLKHQVAGAQANASAPTWTEATFSPLSQTLAGALRISGTVTATQGTPNSAANKWPVSVTDGTNTNTVKAASTAAVAADTAIVVALSPNNNTLANSLITRISDGTNIATVKAASGTVAATDLQLAVGLHPNSNPMKVWDGSNAVTVKAASTAPVATDTSLVVSVNPNTPALPVTLTSTTVTNTIATELSTGLTTFNNNALTATKTAVKAGAGKVHGWMIHNPSAATTYIQVWNVAIASITVGTTAPTWVIPIPAGASANVFTDKGVTHSTEINIAATTTATGLTAPATAAVVSIFYV